MLRTSSADAPSALASAKIRSMAMAQLSACVVQTTSFPLMEARKASSAVSASRISPRKMIEGAQRATCRQACANPPRSTQC